MIEMFKENEMRTSGLIYNSTFEQIKELYQYDPEAAGELAISAIELVLTGDISTDDVNIRLYLAPMRKINEVNIAKYETKVENQRQKKINEMKLDKIAELAAMGYKQREIGEKLGLSQQIISYRLNLIKKTYPELLQTNLQTAQTNLQTVYKNTNDTNGTKTENFVEPVQTVYKDTNDTNSENFVQNSVCKNPGGSATTKEKVDEEPAWKKEFSF